MKTKVLLLLAVFLFTLSMLSYAMSDSVSTAINKKQAEVFSSKLQQKILLNDSQTDQIKSILTLYISQSNFSEENSEITLNKVESVLTQRQKAKFDIIKAEWWNNFIKYLNKQKP